jgi:hypothetical protein
MARREKGFVNIIGSRAASEHKLWSTRLSPATIERFNNAVNGPSYAFVEYALNKTLDEIEAADININIDAQTGRLLDT